MFDDDAALRRPPNSSGEDTLFHCTHRVYGVGMFDTRDVIAADREIREAGTRAPVRVLVGTVSHCHGALDLLSIGAGAA